LTRAVWPSWAMFSSRRYLRWRRSFRNDSSDAAAKSQSWLFLRARRIGRLG
jgi:hypothetical protein